MTPTGWREALREAGLTPGVVLGTGMEGVVVDIGDRRVAKVWHRRSAADLMALATFQRAVAESGSRSRHR